MSSVPPLTPNKEHGRNIQESIAALRSILMIDTPTKALLSASHPSVSSQQAEYQHHQSQLKALSSKAAALEAKVKQAEENAKALESSYQALTKQNKELSRQLELVSSARNTVEEKLDKTTATLKSERAAASRNLSLWKPELERLRRNYDSTSAKSKDLEGRCKSAEVKARQAETRLHEIEREFEKTKAQLTTNQSRQVALQPRLDKAEKQKSQAETDLAKAKAELDMLKSRHLKSLQSMLDSHLQVKNKLKAMEESKKALEMESAKADAERKEAAKAKENAERELANALENYNRMEAQVRDRETNQPTNNQQQQNTAASSDASKSQLEQALANSEELVASKEKKIAALQAQLEVATMQQEETKEDLSTTLPAHQSESTSTEEPASLEDLGSFLRENAYDMNAEMTEQLSKIFRSLQNDLRQAVAGREKAKAQLHAVVSRGQQHAEELATTRETVRNLTSELDDTRAKVSRLREAHPDDYEDYDSGMITSGDDDDDDDGNKHLRKASKRQKQGIQDDIEI
eukprot:Nitzschia sp. Nitz4//scaffold48_size128905//11554//13175//NITZ4_003578-RA/size128905-augustus-gene-0.16-mRNA-1//-1//CDS//3329552916//4382//frame0